MNDTEYQGLVENVKAPESEKTIYTTLEQKSADDKNKPTFKELVNSLWRMEPGPEDSRWPLESALYLEELRSLPDEQPNPATDPHEQFWYLSALVLRTRLFGEIDPIIDKDYTEAVLNKVMKVSEEYQGDQVWERLYRALVAEAYVAAASGEEERRLLLESKGKELRNLHNSLLDDAEDAVNCAFENAEHEVSVEFLRNHATCLRAAQLIKQAGLLPRPTMQNYLGEQE